MKRSLVLLFVTFATFMVARAAAAQAPIRLTVEDAVLRGLDASHRLAEIGARREALLAVEDQRKAASAPQVVVLAGYTRTNHVQAFRIPLGPVIYPDIPDNVRSRVDLQWPIYTGGRLSALTRAAAAEADAVGLDRDAARGDLKLEITRAYWAAVTARAAADVVNAALDRMSAQLTDVRNRFNVGLLPPSDVLNLEAQEARQRQLLIEAQNLLDTSSIDFRRLAGLPPDAPFELVDRLDAPLVPSAQVAALVEAAKGNRPERKALEVRLGGATERKTAAEAERLPVIATAAGYNLAHPNPKIFPRQNVWQSTWDVGVNISWSLFDGGRVRAEVAEAAANQRAVEERLKDFDATVDADVRQRASDLASAQSAIGAADIAVRSAEEARRVLAERFAAGVATNTEVLDAQVALLQAELDRTRARASVHLAAARLDRAIGQ